MLIFYLASCLTTFSLSRFMDLRFQIHMQYCSLQHQTLLSPPDTSTTEHCFCFSPVASFFLELFLHSSSVAYRTPSHLEDSSSRVISFCVFLLSMGFSMQNYCLESSFGVGGYFLLQRTMFCQNSVLWPTHLGCPCVVWLIASLSYTSPSATTRLWSMKG